VILQFDGYDWSELDSTLIKKFQPNTNFTVMVDSIYRNSAVTGGDGSIFLDDAASGFDLSKDYQVVVRVSNKTYSISAIASKRKSCPCGSSGRKIVSYVLDGVRYPGGEVHLPR
jgi:hypothetical protein